MENRKKKLISISQTVVSPYYPILSHVIPSIPCQLLDLTIRQVTEARQLLHQGAWQLEDQRHPWWGSKKTMTQMGLS